MEKEMGFVVARGGVWEAGKIKGRWSEGTNFQ